MEIEQIIIIDSCIIEDIQTSNDLKVDIVILECHYDMLIREYFLHRNVKSLYIIYNLATRTLALIEELKKIIEKNK